MKSPLPRSVLGVCVIALASLLTSPARGQQSPSTGDTQLQAIIVTGSLIKRVDIETPSPVQTVTQLEMQQSGYTNVSDVLRNLSANGQGTLSQSFGEAVASGASGIALRGLSVSGTLVLIDGKRMVNYPISDDNQRSFTDVSAIPFNAVERVEVLKDGASAIYGADAIAGVVNIILKKSYTGTEFTAEVGQSEKGDGATEHLAVISGIGDLSTDGYNAYIAADFHKTDQIFASHRSGGYTTLDWSSLPGGLNTTPGSFGNPYLGNGYPASITGYLINPTPANPDGTYPNGLPGKAFLPGCNATAQALNQCTFRLNELRIQPSTEQINVFSKFTKSLTNDWTASVALSLFNTKAQQVCCSYQSTSYGSGGIVNLATGPGVNPSVVAYPVITVPATYPGNPYGVAAPLVYNFHELGIPEIDTSTNTYRLVVDIKGTAAGWDIDGSLGAMYSRMDLVHRNFLAPGAVQPALNKGYIIGSGASASQQLLAPAGYAYPTSTLDIADIHGSRALFDLPGGPLAIAIGAQYFHKVENYTPPATVASGVQEGNAAFAIGTQNDTSAFMELDAQVFKQLEVDGAVRYDHYDNGVGGSTNPKFSIKYKPVAEFALRGTWGKGFRAPSPAESGQSGAFFGAGQVTDPILCPNPSNTNAKGNFPSQCVVSLTGYQQAGAHLKPVKSTNETFGFIIEPSKAFNISADYYQIKLTNDIISLYAAGGLGAFTSVVRGPPATLPYCTADNVCTSNVLTPVGLTAFATFPYVNAGETKTEGIDVDLQTHFDLGIAGKLGAEINFTHIIEFNQTYGGVQYDFAGTHGPSGVSGDTGTPKNRAVVTLTWEKGRVSVTGTVNYTSSFTITDPSASYLLTCPVALYGSGTTAYSTRFVPASSVPEFLCSVHHFTDVNLYARYAFSDHLAAHASVVNLFGAQPPIDAQTYGGGGQLAYDGALHQDGAVGRFFLVGAAYKF